MINPKDTERDQLSNFKSKKFNIGDLVIFGRRQGEKTLGKIIGWTSDKIAKVQQLESRGRAKNYASGQIWRVDRKLLRHAPKVGTAQTAAVTEHTRVFAIGYHVTFQLDAEFILAKVIRVNQKTLTLETDNGLTYRVPPSFVSVISKS